MLPHTRAMIAAAAYAFITGRKVAGVFDHAAMRERLIAAESRENRLKGFDGNRQAEFGGTLPDLYDAGDKAAFSLEIAGSEARGYDRGSAHHYTAKVTDQLVQVYDHGQEAWFAFDIRDEQTAFDSRAGADASQ
ncbi:hypothetical protein WBP06_11560 [Novosphingobium sp. BL-8H]|uniref:hypothetical protein n=1 Tax=Novosphingobium sp. BL-8H TaxID=3127640 RepID=UPI00375689CE